MQDRFFITPDDLSQRIREKIQSRGLIGLRGLGTLLRQSEENGSQTFDLEMDIPKILSDFGVFINRTEVVEMKRILGSDTYGQVSLIDFVNFLTPPMNLERQKIVERAFDQKDSDRSGSLSINEIQNISHYQSSAMTLLAVRKSSPEALFQNLIKLYQKEGSDSVPREEFIDYYRLISSGIQDDLEFINMVKSSWGV
ncbi:hypothetical protein M9Y10_006530 [Tritrichomonas musculus]|uniref:EF-hand domain-containing protein n=1 Tax=Tritrichomonas musculus TaxID=1915356 RepID=A0ABR2JFF8_9EUKA